jgi:anti-repressor protein
MSAVALFERDGWSVRTITIDNEPWFVASDICRELDLGNTSDVLRRIDDEDKGVSSIDTPGGRQDMRIVNESGLWTLVLGSRKPEAKAFKRWLTSEVIPTIRRTGSYGTPTPLAMPTHSEALRGWATALDENTELRAVNAVLAPKAELHDALVGSDGDLSVREAAQALVRAGIETGQGRLFASLVSLNWLDKSKQPFQRQIERGVLVRKVTTYTDNLGDVHASTQVRVTPKGLAELVRRLGPPSMALVPAEVS